MPIDVSAEATIARLPAEVMTYVSDPANDPSWIGGVVEAELLSDPPLARGSQVRRTAKFLGRRFDYVTEVTEWQPPEALAMRATSPFPMDIRYEFQENGGCTLARVRVQGEGGGFFRLAAPLLAPQVRRNIRADVERLKALLESER